MGLFDTTIGRAFGCSLLSSSDGEGVRMLTEGGISY
jgi:hypothetical protein